jgi:hypothetical protein
MQAAPRDGELGADFELMPGTVYSGKVETVLQAISTGQTQASGLAVTPKAVESAPFVVRVKLDDQELSKRYRRAAPGRRRYLPRP